MSMSIDWQRIHDRMAETQQGLERGSALSPADIGKILKTRAMAFARESEKQDKNEESIEVLEFLLADENYAIELSFIDEVCLLKNLTVLPGIPPFVPGIINVRGRVYSVIDLKKFFELSDSGLTELSKVIIVKHDGIEAGILADAVAGIRTVFLKNIQPSLPTLTGARQEYLQGVARDQLIILDARRLLSDEKLVFG
jgi:purine-binding chemotaxis protein CheW